MRDKFLTEAMGECFHRFGETASGPGFLECRCGKVFSLSEYSATNIDFSTWEGFGKLWEFAQEQEWWVDFLNKQGFLFCTPASFQLNNFINPDQFADALYCFLKEQS